MKRLLPFCLAAVLAILALPASAQRRPSRGSGVGTDTGPRSVTVLGRVRSAESDAPIPSVRVELRAGSGEMIGSRFTNYDGEFTFMNLTAGNYEVSIEETGYQPYRERVEIHESRGAENIVLIFLQANPAAGPKPPGSTISARMLSLPERARKEYAKGVAELYEKKNPSASLPHFQHAIEAASGFYEAYHQTGVALRSLGRNEEAEAAWRKAIELGNGHFAGSHFTLASLLGDLKRYADEESIARAGLQIEPQSWRGNYELARALLYLNRQDEAEKAIQQALSVKPDLAKAYLILADIHMGRDDRAALVRDLDNYLRLEPSGPQSDNVRSVREQTIREMGEAKVSTPPQTPPR